MTEKRLRCIALFLSAGVFGVRNRPQRLICALLTSLCLGTFLTSCAGVPAYAPRAAFSIDRDIAELHQQFDTAASISAYYAQGAETTDRRNAFIAGRLVLYDLEYARFIAHFHLGRATEQTAFDAVALGIGFATTIAGGAHTKTVLGAVTTALTGARTSFEKNFYDDKTAQALVLQMTAERKAALLPIVRGAKSSIADYPLTTALADLTNYQIAGTVDGALIGIQKDASIKDAGATSVLDQYRTTSFVLRTSGERIRAWIWPGWASQDRDGTAFDALGQPIPANSQHVDMLRDEFVKLGIGGIAIANFLGDARLEPQRQTAIKDLSIS